MSTASGNADPFAQEESQTQGVTKAHITDGQGCWSIIRRPITARSWKQLSWAQIRLAAYSQGSRPTGGPGNSYSEDPSQRRLRFKLDGLVTAEAQPHIRRLSNRWLSITGMIIHGHLTCRDSFGDIFTLTSGVEPTATSNSYIHETANSLSS